MEPSGSCSVLVEEAVDLLSRRSTHDGLQLGRGGATEPLHTGEVLQQSQSLDPAHPGDLLHQSQDQRVQQLAGSPPPERVLLALTVDLWTRTAAIKHANVRLFPHFLLNQGLFEEVVASVKAAAFFSLLLFGIKEDQTLNFVERHRSRLTCALPKLKHWEFSTRLVPTRREKASRSVALTLNWMLAELK